MFKSRSRRTRRIAKVTSMTAAILAALIVISSQASGSTYGADANPVTPTEVTLQGNVLCNRATETKDWFWDPKDGDHTPFFMRSRAHPRSRTGSIKS